MNGKIQVKIIEKTNTISRGRSRKKINNDEKNLRDKKWRRLCNKKSKQDVNY